MLISCSEYDFLLLNGCAQVCGQLACGEHHCCAISSGKMRFPTDAWRQMLYYESLEYPPPPPPPVVTSYVVSGIRSVPKMVLILTGIPAAFPCLWRRRSQNDDGFDWDLTYISTRAHLHEH
eukprot:COSAG05_NODE_2714_length_2737_cov_140.062412_6_plen_121_part_00